MQLSDLDVAKCLELSTEKVKELVDEAARTKNSGNEARVTYVVPSRNRGALAWSAPSDILRVAAPLIKADRRVKTVSMNSFRVLTYKSLEFVITLHG